MSEVYSSRENALSETVERILTQRPGAEPLPIREGLPPTFRMRADAHYVELLDSAPRPGIELIPVSAIDVRADSPAASPSAALVQSIARHGVLQPLLVQPRDGRHRLLSGRQRLAAASAAGLREVPCIVHHSDDDAAAAIVTAANMFGTERDAAAQTADRAGVAGPTRELAQSLMSLGACAGLLAAPAPQLTHRVAIDLLRAEAWRAVCLLQIMRVLRNEAELHRRPVSARAAAQRLVDAMQHECRLRGVAIAFEPSSSDVTLDVDEDALVYSLGGLLTAVLALPGGRAPQLLGLLATAAGGHYSLTATHPSLRTWFAAEPWPDDSVAGAALAAVRRVIEAADGRLDVAVRRTAEIRITLPAVQ